MRWRKRKEVGEGQKGNRGRGGEGQQGDRDRGGEGGRRREGEKR